MTTAMTAIADNRELLELLRTIDLACDRVLAAKAMEPVAQAIVVMQEFSKIVEGKRLYDAAAEAQA